MIKTAGLNAWIMPLHPKNAAPLRMFCFPYAGGGASSYRLWSQAFPGKAEVLAVQIPGREQRLAEPAFTELIPLVERLAAEISPWLDRPYLFFGHSMGAFICFELVRHLRRLGKPLPVRLCVSGARAPHIPNPHPNIHQLSEIEFLYEIQHLEGTPPEVLQNRELMQILLPPLRADFSVCETYIYTADKPLECPLSVFGGRQDPRVSYQHLIAWRQHTQNAFTLHMFPGGHFFLHSASRSILDTLEQSIEAALAQPD